MTLQSKVKARNRFLKIIDVDNDGDEDGDEDGDDDDNDEYEDDNVCIAASGQWIFPSHCLQDPHCSLQG